MAVTLAAIMDPAPHVGITLDGFAASGVTVRVWREWGGQRAVVRGGARLVVSGSDYLIDWDAPLALPVTYRYEVLAGTTPAGDGHATVTVPASFGWISDPLDPTGGVPIWSGLRHAPAGASLAAAAGTEWSLPTMGGVIHVVGGGLPIGYGPGAATPASIPLDLITATAEQTTQLALLLERATPQFLIRALPEWAPLPPVGYWRVSRARKPLGGFLGGTMWRWGLVGTQVRPQTLSIVAPLWTYDQVQALRDRSTYSQVQAVASAGGVSYTGDKAEPRMGG